MSSPPLHLSSSPHLLLSPPSLLLLSSTPPLPTFPPPVLLARRADVPAPEQPELFLKKLQQCCTVFDFMDTLSDLKMKEYKRSTLNELVDYVTVSRGYLTEQAYPEVVKMVRGGGAWAAAGRRIWSRD